MLVKKKEHIKKKKNTGYECRLSGFAFSPKCNYWSELVTYDCNFFQLLSKYFPLCRERLLSSDRKVEREPSQKVTSATTIHQEKTNVISYALIIERVSKLNVSPTCWPFYEFLHPLRAGDYCISGGTRSYLHSGQTLSMCCGRQTCCKT